MPDDSAHGPAPLVVGVVPGQHPEVLQTAASLAKSLAAPLICAYVDEASYLVEWDPARSAHRLSLHPDADDARIRATAQELRSVVEALCVPLGIDWTLRTLAGDPARAIGRLAADTNACHDRGGDPRTRHRPPHLRRAERLRGGMAQPPSGTSDPDRSGRRSGRKKVKRKYLFGALVLPHYRRVSSICRPEERPTPKLLRSAYPPITHSGALCFAQHSTCCAVPGPRA